MTASTPARRLPWKPLGLRREVLILMPVALLLLIVLSTFTLFSYRSAVDLLAEEQRRLAATWAERLAERLAAGEAVGLEPLLQEVPGSEAVALVGADGEPVATAGNPPPIDWAALSGGRLPSRSEGFGPETATGESILGVAPLAGSEGRRFLQIHLAAPVLAGQRRSLPLLTVVVLGINAALGVLLILFFRHLLTPYEALLERAREVAGQPEEGDEASFLISTFERAVTALAEGRRRGDDEDIAALQRTLSASLESGLLLLDREGVVMAINPVGARMLSLDPSGTGMHLSRLLAAHGQLVEVLGEAVASRRGLRRRELRLAPEGEELTVGLSVHTLRRDDGEVRAYLVLFSDLTEIQRQAEELRQAESLAQLGELAAGVAHELRNSLATLRGYLTLIERHPEEESVNDYLAEIRHESDQLQRILEDFLVFARPGTAEMESVVLEDVVRRAVADPALEQTAVRFRDEPAGGHRIEGDPSLLEQAVRNLLHNAAAVTAAGEVIDVSVEATEDGVTLAIEDRGPGLPEEVRERLFQPFVSGRSDGVGLGLAISHRIVTLHGGRLRLEDRSGGGTRAVIVLPAADARA